MAVRSWIRKLFEPRSPRSIRKAPARCRPSVEALEDRALLTVSFAPAAAYSVSPGSLPRAVAVGDFNQDGKPDLITANSLNTTVSVMLGKGNGTFQPALISASGNLARSIAVGDFNRDGKLDAALTGDVPIGEEKFSGMNVLLGNGNGTFELSSGYLTGGQATAATAADFNGNGRLDLAYANQDDNNVSVLLDGNGFFQAPRNLAMGTEPLSLAVGDFNGDGRLDLASANFESYNVSVRLGNGNGSFQTAQSYGTNQGRPSSVAAKDLNGDGRLDLVTSNLDTGTVSVFRGNGNGTFQTPVAYATEFQPRHVAVGDLDNDGAPDLVTVGESQFVSVLLNDRNGSFLPKSLFNANTIPHDVAIADLNGDGRLDLVANGAGASAVTVLLNTTGLTIASNQAAVTANEGTQVTNTGTFDDPSGRAAVTLTASLGTVTKNNTTGTWSWSYTPPDGPAGPVPVTITATNTAGQTATTTFNLTVNNVAPTRTTLLLNNGATIGLATQVLSYRLVASDAPTDQTAGFQYTVNWADGSLAQIVARTPLNNGTSLTHVYTTAGDYTAGMFATDKDGGVSEVARRTVTVLPVTSDNMQLVIDLQGSITMQATTNAQFQAVVAAVNGLPAQFAPVTITLNLGSGTYSGTTASPKAGITLKIVGTAGTTTIVGASPSLNVGGEGSVIVTDVALVNSTNAPTVMVSGGNLTLRNVTIDESDVADQAAIRITGGTVDLGTEDSPGGNTFNVKGKGKLIKNTSPGNVSAVGNKFDVDDVALTSPYRIEDGIDHAADTGSGGVVTFVPGNLFVTVNGGSIQRGIDAVAEGGTVNIEPGSYGQYNAGSKLVTVRFEGGPTLSQQRSALDPTKRDLVVTGTAGNDHIQFTQGGGAIQAQVQGVPNGRFSPNVRIMAYGLAGDDDIKVAGGITLPAWLFGGDGNDRLQGGGDSVLVGGAGDDLLTGGKGRAVMIGGRGADQLVGNSDDDLLIGGISLFDDDLTALDAIQGEWTSGRSYADRVANLSGAGTGPRANGDVVLKVSGPDATVYDDDATDVLTGASGADWFFANLSGGLAVDRIDGLGGSELVEELGTPQP